MYAEKASKRDEISLQLALVKKGKGLYRKS